MVTWRSLLALVVVLVIGAATAWAGAEVSATEVSSGPDGARADGDSSAGGQALSRDGRYVAFASSASNLTIGDTNGATDVFVRDRRAGVTTRVTDGGAERVPQISASGSVLAYLGDEGGCSRVHVARWKTGAPQEVPMTRPDGTEPTLDVQAFALSPDGRYVASMTARPEFGLSCAAAEASEDGHPGHGDLVLELFDRRSGKVQEIPTGDLDPVMFDEVALSARGRVLVVATEPGASSRNRGTTRLMAIDTSSGRRTLVNRDWRGRADVPRNRAWWPDISADGRFVAFATEARLVRGDSGRDQDVYVRDLRRARTRRASVGTRGAGLGQAGYPAISGSGRFVTFVAGDVATASIGEVFVRDTARRRTRSFTPGGDGSYPAVSGDGRTVAYRAFPEATRPHTESGRAAVLVAGP
jgi:Tol biopolymer transport system component